MKRSPHLRISVIFVFNSVFALLSLQVDHVLTSGLVSNNDTLSRNISLNRSETVICHLADGITVHQTRPCLSLSTKPMDSSTDTEVGDLTSHTTVSSSSVSSSKKNNERLSSTSESPLKLESLSVDNIIEDTESLHPNSRFNLNVGGFTVAVCFTVSLAAYLVIVIWKRISMNAFQNQELLLNEDDIGDINDEDMRYFEAACIQIET